jgi:hypothetical protein
MNFLRDIITSGSQNHRGTFYFNLRTFASVLIIGHSSTSFFSDCLIRWFIVTRSHIIFRVIIHHLFLEKMFQTNHIMSIFINFITKSKVSGRYGWRGYMLVYYFLMLTAIRLTSQYWIIMRVCSHDTFRTMI